MSKFYNEFGYILIEDKDYDLMFNGIIIANDKNKKINALKLAKSLYNNQYFLYLYKVEPILYNLEKRQYLINMKAFITAMDIELLPNGDFSVKLAKNNPSGMISIKPKAIRSNNDLEFMAEDKDTSLSFGIAEQNQFKDKIVSYNRKAEHKFIFQHKQYHFVHKSEIQAIVNLGANEQLVNRFIVDKDYGIDKTVYG